MAAYLDSADASAEHTALVTSSEWGCVNHAADPDDDDVECYVVDDERLAQAEAHEQMLDSDAGRIARLEDALAAAEAERESLRAQLQTERSQHGVTKNKLGNEKRWTDQRMATLQQTFDAFLALNEIDVDCEHGRKPVRCLVCLSSWLRALGSKQRARQTGA